MWRSRRRSALAAAAVAASVIAFGCIGNGDRPEGFPLDSGVQGTITIGPMCPVVQEGTACPDEPYQATIVIYDDRGDEVLTFESNIAGVFRANLWPGRYVLAPQAPDPGGPPFAEEQEFEVREGAFIDVAVQYDSGIR